ncbi:hypothetical protein [Nonomuraea sp. NPDC049758]|uniref:hypothetical protein n=1 Tax=Nonomuraea sp. NPDC049758 TaxID=3154360 RepID=UPI0034441422
MDEDVLSRWRGRSMVEGWSLADDWWTPAVAYAIKAVTDGGDLPRACEELGAARAGAGVGISEGLGDLAALFAVTDRGEPTFPLVRAYAAGWAEQSFAPMNDLQCEDPLTGLATVAYLRTRLGELYRGAVAGGHLLVVAEPYGQIAELAERLAAALNLATALRKAFTGDETLALLAPTRVGAVTREDDRLAGKIADLRATEILHGRRPRVRVRRLPRAHAQALALIRTLSLGP